MKKIKHNTFTYLFTITILVSFMPAPNLFAASQLKNNNVETIIFIRHAEKPSAGLGQLSCKGLNRSLKLPAYFKANHPKPDYIFAPNPSVKHKEYDGDKNYYSYVRPLATIEPTAISLGMPVNTEIAADDTKTLISNLLKPKYHNSVIYVAWEHKDIEKAAKVLKNKFNIKTTIPTWENDDYDRVYVFKINWDNPKEKSSLTITKENLNGLSSTCPNIF